MTTFHRRKGPSVEEMTLWRDACGVYQETDGTPWSDGELAERGWQPAVPRHCPECHATRAHVRDGLDLVCPHCKKRREVVDTRHR